MGKSEIESHCHISNHSVNKFKSFNRAIILKSHFSSNLKLLIFVLNLTHFVSTDFSHNIESYVTHAQLVSDHTHSQLLQYS